jgi:acyl-homoserine-lactone acylase
MYKVSPQGGNDRLNPRGERLLKVLGRNRKISLNEIKAMAFDTYVVPADVFVPLLVAAYEARKHEIRNPGIVHAINILSAWDRRSSKQSIAQTYAYFWGRSYQELNSKARFERFLNYSRYQIDIHSPNEQSAALAALADAIKQIREKFGKGDVPWGEVNVVVRGGKFPLGGTGLFDVLHPDSGEEQKSGRIYDNDGWGHMMVVEEGNPKKIWSLLPYGESEDPKSPHYNDMTKLHSRTGLKRFWFTPENILGHTESVWGEQGRIDGLIQKCGNELVTCGGKTVQ